MLCRPYSVRFPAKVGTVTVNDVEKGLLEFKPSTDKLPITIYFGVDAKKNIGLWAGLNVPSLKYLHINVARTGHRGGLC